MIAASHLSATLALLLFISTNSFHGTAAAAAAVGNNTSHNVDGRLSIVAAADDHVDCVDNEEAHVNRLFSRHHSKTGKTKKTSKSSKSRRGKSAKKKCPPTDLTASPTSKESATSTAPPTGAPPAKTDTPGPTSAFIKPTVAPSPSKVEASTLMPLSQSPSQSPDMTASPSNESATSTAPPTGAPQAKPDTPGPTSAFIKPTVAPSPSKVEASTLMPLTQTLSQQSPSFTRFESWKIVADDGAAYDHFGESVAVFGDTLVAGAYGDDDKGYWSGSAYIYYRDPDTKEWIFQQKLVADDGAEDDHFGYSIAVFGDTLVVGATGDDDDNGDSSGSAYIYQQDPQTKEWILQQKLVADDGAAEDYFGRSVAIYDNTLVVGERRDDTEKGNDSGSAYIYHRNPETKEWTLQQKLVPDDGAADDNFGARVAIYDNTLVVGAYRDDDKGINSGSAYIYHQDHETKEWIFQQKLVADDGAAYEWFGSSVDIFGDTLVVGAQYDDTDKGYWSGSAYIYNRDLQTKEWILQQKLVPEDGAADDKFGRSVAIYGGTVVVGAYEDDDKGEDSGSAYIYHQDSETKEWILQQKLVPDDGAAYKWFGSSVAIYGNTVIVGADGDDDKGYISGSVYVYS